MGWKLRHYQESAITKTLGWLGNNDGNPLIVLPTGTGKTPVLSSLTTSFIDDYKDARILHLTHVSELIEQAYKTLTSMHNNMSVGCYSAGLGKKELFNQVICAGIQSIYAKAKHLGTVDITIVDEAHSIPFKNDTMYRRFLDEVKSLNPYMRTIGLTATPYRLQGGSLTSGENPMFNGTSYEYPIVDAFKEGYLTPIIPKGTDTRFNLSGVKKSGGEFVAKQLQEAVDLDSINRRAVEEIIHIGMTENRKSWLVFCSGVDHAHHVSDYFKRNGITSAVIHGGTPKAERRDALQKFKHGHITALCNVDCLTTGVDAPCIDLIAMLRPTMSPGLFCQMLGRGTRLIDPTIGQLGTTEQRLDAIANSIKPNCRVLDFARNTLTHGPIDQIIPPPEPNQKKKGMGEAPIKECPECYEFVYASARFCPNCDHAFPPPKPDIVASASTEALISTQLAPKWFDVAEVSYSSGFDTNKVKCMQVNYRNGLTRYTEVVRFENPKARDIAVRWWTRHVAGSKVPRTTAEALARIREVPKPKRICVRKKAYRDKKGKKQFVDDIIGREF